MKKPANLRTKTFQRYRTWLLRELADEIWFWSAHARDEGWLAEAVQSVAKIDPDISQAMVEQAMRLAIKRNRKTIASNKRQLTKRREANGWIERALQSPQRAEVVTSSEFAALLPSRSLVPSEVGSSAVVLQFRPRRIVD